MHSWVDILNSLRYVPTKVTENSQFKHAKTGIRVVAIITHPQTQSKHLEGYIIARTNP